MLTPAKGFPESASMTWQMMPKWPPVFGLLFTEDLVACSNCSTGIFCALLFCIGDDEQIKSVIAIDLIRWDVVDISLSEIGKTRSVRKPKIVKM